jgi:hypothetical protein
MASPRDLTNLAKFDGRRGREVEKGKNSIRRGGRGENSRVNREENSPKNEKLTLKNLEDSKQ